MKGPSSSPPSVWFDPQLRASSEQLTRAVHAVQRYLESQEIELGLRSRRRTPKASRSFKCAVEAICCNLIVVKLAGPDTLLAVPLSHAMMWGRGRYANPVYGQHFLDLIKLLQRLDLITRTRTGFRVSSKLKAQTLVVVSDRINQFVPAQVIRWDFIRREVDHELIVLKADKDEDGRSLPINYRETKDTKRWRGQVARINRWLATSHIELLPSDPAAAYTDEDGYLIAHFRRSLHRSFNNGSFRQGGRLWGGFWMAMKREDRFRCIRINDETIADVDYQQLYPRLAYARAQAAPPEGDFYDVAGDGSSRAGWKILINAMLFADKRLGGWPVGCGEHFPNIRSIKQAIAMVERKHAPIVHLFGKGLGYELMWMESHILIDVITLLFKMDIPALPLHDAVLVARSQAETAKDVMEHELERRIQYRGATVEIDFGST